MNKNHYRIIFSKSKNMFIAVAENVKNKTKSAGQSTGPTTKIKSSHTEEADSFQNNWIVKSLVASLSFWVFLAPVYANIQVDPSANAANRPVIGVGKNPQGQNVPVINIQTPKNGVSHNKYKQMDVLANGAVINNSRNGANSSLVGKVTANPFLAKGEARLILNEVNSNAATRFEGNLEIAGQRADIIIANPSGINIKGGGFINANKATFTTGKSQLNADGSLKQLIVDQGKITVSGNAGSNLGLGGNNNNADYVDIYTRALEINAQLHAKNAINVVTGANTINNDSGDIEAKTSKEKAPALAIDVKALGGMYAENIYIMGTEKGLGVTNAGTLQAYDNLVVNNAGKITHTGSMSTTYDKGPRSNEKNGVVVLGAGPKAPVPVPTGLILSTTGPNANIDISGSLSSHGDISIYSGNDLNVNTKNIKIEKASALNSGMTPLSNGSKSELSIWKDSSLLNLNAQGNINLKEGADVKNLTKGDVYLNAKNINLALNAAVSGGGDLKLFADENLTTNKSNLKASNLLNISAQKDLKLIESNLTGYDGINIQSKSIDSNLLIDGGKITSNHDLNVYGGGDVALKQIELDKEGPQLINGKLEYPAETVGKAGSKPNPLSKVKTGLKNINIVSGKNLLWDYSKKEIPVVAGAVQVEANNKIELKGDKNVLAAQNGIHLLANELQIDSELHSGKEINITSKTKDLTLSRDFSAVDNIDVTALDGNLAVQNLKATSDKGRIALFAKKNAKIEGTLENKLSLSGAKGVNIGSVGEGDVNFQHTNLHSTNGGVIVTSGKNTDINDSAMNAKGNVELFAKENLILDGVTSASKQHTALNAKKNIYINSRAGEKEVTILTSNKKSQLKSDGILSLISGKHQVIQNAKLTGGAILVEAEGLLNAHKNVEFDATGSTLLKNDKKLKDLDGDLSIQTNNALTLDPLKIQKLQAQGDIELTSKKGALTLIGRGGDKGNGSEKVLKLDTANGGIRLEGTKVDIQGSDLKAKKDINIISTKDDLNVDGVKNKLLNIQLRDNLNNLKDIQDSLANKLNDLINSEEFKKYNDELKSISHQTTTGAGLLQQGGPSTGIGNFLLAEANQKKVDLEKKNRYMLINKNDYENKLRETESSINFFNNAVNGYEHKGANLKSSSGNINITSAKGLSISGSNIEVTTGTVNLEAQGVLKDQYVSSTIKDGTNTPRTMSASLIVDGHTNFYDIGNESAENYRMQTTVNPTIITGNEGVNIRAVGTTENDNLILQAVGVVSKNGNVSIEANKSILFDAAIEQGYDRSTKISKKKSWGGLKKKTKITVSENNDVDAASVDIQAKNITIQNKDTKQNNDTKTSIDIYSSKLNADGGKISIRSAGDLNFLTVEELESSKVDVTKKSSFAGIKYNKSKTNTTRTQVTELPAKLKADYIGTKSGFDTRLVGTEFEYLKEATIESGGKIELLGAKTNITELLKKEKNSVVWQSMQDKGLITETAQLPQFNGPTAPTFKGKGGLVVQVPVGEKDQNKVQLRDEIIKLSKQPGNAYLKELVNRDDIDWQKVILAQKDWNYKSQGLTGAGAAIIVIIVTILTYGAGTSAAAGIGAGAAGTGAAGAGAAAAGSTTVGMGASMLGAAGVTTTTVGGVTTITGVSTLGAMANAAVASLASQASVSLINNGGDIGKTVKDLGSKDSVKNLAASVATAGIMSQVGTALNLKPDSAIFSDRLLNNFTTSVGSTLVQTAVKGGDLEENLKSALLSGLAGSLQGELALNIKGLEDVNYIAHKIAHAAAGCVAGAIQKSCEAGAIGGAVGEIVASLSPPSNGLLYTEEEKQKILLVGQMTSGVIAAYAGYDVNAASNSANTALRNNAFNEKNVKQLLEQAKGYMGEKGGEALDAVSRGIAKGDIKTLKNVQTQIAEYLLKKADSGGLSQAEMVTFGTLYALNETLFPTNILDAIPGGGKAVGKGNDLLKGIRATAPASAVSATARLGLREDLAKLANVPRNIDSQPANIWGKSLQDIKYSFEMDGAVLTLVPPKSGTSGLAQVYKVEKSATGIKEVEYHPGGGQHSKSGDMYYKIVMNDGTHIRIIDPNSSFKPGTIASNQIYLNQNGQKLKYQNGKWEIWK